MLGSRPRSSPREWNQPPPPPPCQAACLKGESGCWCVFTSVCTTAVEQISIPRPWMRQSLQCRQCDRTQQPSCNDEWCAHPLVLMQGQRPARMSTAQKQYAETQTAEVHLHKLPASCQQEPVWCLTHGLRSSIMQNIREQAKETCHMQLRHAMSPEVSVVQAANSASSAFCTKNQGEGWGNSP